MSRRGKKNNKKEVVVEPKTYSLQEIQEQQKFSVAQVKIFKEVCKDCQRKDFESTLRGVERILKNLPENGEALCMKSLSLYSLNRATVEEVTKGFKHGLRNNLKSSTSWQLYGIFCRSEKNYEEAMKAFKAMDNIDKNSLFLKRDLYCLQIQNKKFKDALKTREDMTLLKNDYANN